MITKGSDLPPLSSRIVHELEEPSIPAIKEDVFSGMISITVKNGVERYQEYVQIELAKGISEIEGLSDKARKRMADLKVEEIVRPIII